MGFFKAKNIRGCSRFYWVIKKRDSKKLGGTGKVKTIEYYLGGWLNNFKYLSWYFWNNDIKLDECLNKFIIFKLNTVQLKNDVSYQLSSNNKLILRSYRNSNIDLRTKFYKDFKNSTQDYLDNIISSYQDFCDDINLIIRYLDFYNQFIGFANKSKLTDTDSYVSNCDLAEDCFSHCQSILEGLLKNNGERSLTLNFSALKSPIKSA